MPKKAESEAKYRKEASKYSEADWARMANEAAFRKALRGNNLFSDSFLANLEKKYGGAAQPKAKPKPKHIHKPKPKATPKSIPLPSVHHAAKEARALYRQKKGITAEQGSCPAGKVPPGKVCVRGFWRAKKGK